MGGTIRSSSHCGACGGFWKFIKPPHRHFFTEECKAHDLAYESGGNRKQADKKLFFDMVYKSVDYYRDRKATAMWWFVTLAFLYYLAVRIFGKSRFVKN